MNAELTIESESKRSQLKNMAESAGASVVEEKETATHLIYQATVSKPDNEHCTPLQGKLPSSF